METLTSQFAAAGTYDPTRALEFVGPKGYIHNWIYVGGPGLPSKAEHAATPRRPLKTGVEAEKTRLRNQIARAETAGYSAKGSPAAQRLRKLEGAPNVSPPPASKGWIYVGGTGLPKDHPYGAGDRFMATSPVHGQIEGKITRVRSGGNITGRTTEGKRVNVHRSHVTHVAAQGTPPAKRGEKVVLKAPHPKRERAAKAAERPEYHEYRVTTDTGVGNEKFSTREAAVAHARKMHAKGDVTRTEIRGIREGGPRNGTLIVRRDKREEGAQAAHAKHKATVTKAKMHSPYRAGQVVRAHHAVYGDVQVTVTRVHPSGNIVGTVHQPGKPDVQYVAFKHTDIARVLKRRPSATRSAVQIRKPSESETAMVRALSALRENRASGWREIAGTGGALVQVASDGRYDVRFGPSIRRYPDAESASRAILRGRQSNAGKLAGLTSGKVTKITTPEAQAKRTAEVKELTPRQRKLYFKLRHAGTPHHEALVRVGKG